MKWAEKLTDEATVRQAAETSLNIGQALDKLGIARGGKAYRAFEAACDAFGIDRTFPAKYTAQRTPFEKVFVENSPYINNRINLKKWLLEAGLLENKCILCGQGPVWNDRPLVLQLDHINGVSNDHRIENLRILCPNCHTQTETFAGKRRIED